MKKGISPLIAVVLLIAATVTVAALLASWAKTYSMGQIGQFETKTGVFECSSGVISLISNDYPKIVSDKIIAVIEVAGAPLGNFTFEVMYNESGIEKINVLKDTENLALSPGRVGTVISENLTQKGINSKDVLKVRINSNCSEVNTEWLTIK